MTLHRATSKPQEKFEKDHYVPLQEELLDAKGPSPLARIFPIIQWLPKYKTEFVVSDIRGGLTIGCVLMAQSVAHAELSGVSLIHGPYSCVFPPIVYMFLGTSFHASVGTGGLIALLTGVELERYATEEERTHAGMILALLVGLILVVMGALRLAGLVRFMSRPALSGFVTASALLIIASQLPGALGMAKQGFFSLLRQVLGDTGFHCPTALLSLCVLTFLVGAAKLKTYAKSKIGKTLLEFKELIAMIMATTFCATLGASMGIDIVGKLPQGLPKPVDIRASPHLIQELLPGAFLLAIVVFISSFAAAKKFGMLGGYDIDATSELLALGFANSIGGCFGAIPVQVGLSRTSIAYSTGARTQLGVSLTTASVIALTLSALTGLFTNMPRCVLNCVIIAAARSLCEFEQIPRLYRLAATRRDLKDLLVWVTAFVATVILGAFQGALCAMAFSLMLLVLEVAEPNLVVLERDLTVGGRWVSCSDVPGLTKAQNVSSGILVVRVDGALFYANAERFREQIEKLEHSREDSSSPPHSIILDFSCIPFIDATVIQVLEEMVDAWKRRKVILRIACAVGRTRGVLKQELGKLTGQRNFNIDVEDAHSEIVSMKSTSA